VLANQLPLDFTQNQADELMPRNPAPWTRRGLSHQHRRLDLSRFALAIILATPVVSVSVSEPQKKSLEISVCKCVAQSPI
jgi:hypothetical protein